MAHLRRQGLQLNKSESASTSYTYYNQTFDDITDLFLFACSHGDYVLAYDLLQGGDVKADVSDKMGTSALHLAIENEHFEVVKVLLHTIPYEQFRDALLLAIYLGHTNIIDFILNHQTYRTFCGAFLDPTDPQAYDDSQFSSDITPIILAAQYNRLPTVHYLLTHGERIKKPHLSMCSCDECIESAASDSFRQAQVRLSAYKGLSSEVYIALAYRDPILQAFELSHELRTSAKTEYYFGEEYKKLANQLSVFVARLLHNVRGHEELEIVLNKTGLPHEEKYETLARFGLAVQYREKPFVSHSNCQQKLNAIWYENISFLTNVDAFKRAMFYVGYIICFPFIALAYYILPKSKIGSLCQQPNLKFKAYIASYFIFIALIIASSNFSIIDLTTTKFLSDYNPTIYKNYIQLIFKNNDVRNDLINYINTTNDTVVNCDISLRFIEPNVFQIAMFIWIIGFAWNEFNQIASLGIDVYLKVPSNYVDCSMNILYLFYFLFLFSSMVYTRLAMNEFQSSTYWINIARYKKMSDIEKQYYISKTLHLLYWINADRFYWKNGDLQNLAEGFFAMGNVVSVCRICFLLPISAFVGPLQVMLDRMMVDISKWISIILIFFIAFSCSLFFIFSFYAIVLQQRAFIDASNTNSSSTIISVIDGNITIPDNAKCSDYFYELLNQTIQLPNNTGDNSNSNNGTTGATDICEQSSDYNILKKIGSYPAIYYFGESFPRTLLTTFFTLFMNVGKSGLPDRGYELVTLSCFKPDLNSYLSGFDSIMSNLGFILYSLFIFICFTVLINTLIAMLEQTIEDIDDRADIEWKFARSKLYMKYIQDDKFLPVPFNICPSPTSIINLMKRIKQMISTRRITKNNNVIKIPTQNRLENLLYFNIEGHPSSNDKMNTESELDDFKNEKIFKRKNSDTANDSLTYKIVIERIVKRFLLYYRNSRIDLDEGQDALQLKEMKHDVTSFSFELFHEIEGLDELQDTIENSMNKLNNNFKNTFNLEQIKLHLSNKKE
ncbi:unnamed protein product [Rotaria socialis]|uniref:Transient receptor ion channel domain-containing protein n=1 Tax=Rotaria socialis TaxID=392032 RepID=A0A817QFL9_9BILA|nr:unnamed protein product [Rotaria socialis]CAF4127456.1 unnamed protein product [Rotaria socialis]